MIVRWSPLDRPDAIEILERLEQVLQSWRGTPWLEGQRCKGERGGVDCRYFVAGVLDELYGVDHARALPRVANDIGVNDARAGARAVEAMMALYPHTINRSGLAEPGDILIARRGMGPGHALIVGPRPNVAWHAMRGIGVTTIGPGRLSNLVMRIYRMSRKESWTPK